MNLLDADELGYVLKALRIISKPGTLLFVWYPEHLKRATSNHTRLEQCPLCTEEAVRSGLGGVVYHTRGSNCYKDAKSIHQHGRTRSQKIKI